MQRNFAYRNSSADGLPQRTHCRTYSANCLPQRTHAVHLRMSNRCALDACLRQGKIEDGYVSRPWGQVAQQRERSHICEGRLARRFGQQEERVEVE